MGFFDRLLGRSENRSAARTADAFLAQHFGLAGGMGNATPDAVLSNLSVAARCVALRSELLASVGLHLYRRTTDGGRERADDVPLYSVLHDLANADLTAFEARELMVRSLDLFGNAYARLERDSRGQVTALYPIPAPDVAVERLGSGRLRYRVTDPRGGVSVYLSDEILHVRGPSRDGVMGQSPIAIARGALSLAMAQADTASNLMTNAMRPSGMLSFTGRLTKDMIDNLRAQLEDRFQGSMNAGRVMVLDSDAKFSPIAFTPEDSEFLDSRKLANEDVARIFGVPPTAVGILDRGTYSNVEQEASSLVQNSLGPLAKRIETALMRCALTPAGRRTLYVEHSLDSLLRGDVKSRFESYRIGREIGALSANDVRRRENESPVEGGDAYHMPANWIGLNAPAVP